MIYLFEGVDGVGKTALARLFSEKKGITIFKSAAQKQPMIDLEEAYKHDWRFLLDFFSQTASTPFDVIFDRGFLSEFVYGMLLRSDNVIQKFGSVENFYSLTVEYCNKFSALSGVYIFLTSKKPLKEISNPSISFNWQLIDSKFLELHNKLSAKKILIDTSDRDIESTYNELIEKLRTLH